MIGRFREVLLYIYIYPSVIHMSSTGSSHPSIVYIPRYIVQIPRFLSVRFPINWKQYALQFLQLFTYAVITYMSHIANTGHPFIYIYIYIYICCIIYYENKNNAQITNVNRILKNYSLQTTCSKSDRAATWWPLTHLTLTWLANSPIH